MRVMMKTIWTTPARRPDLSRRIGLTESFEGVKTPLAGATVLADVSEPRLPRGVARLICQPRSGLRGSSRLCTDLLGSCTLTRRAHEGVSIWATRGFR